MTSVAALLALLLATGAGAAGPRTLLAGDMPLAGAPSGGAGLPSNMAPGPAPSEPPADILFTFSAARASLTADKLTLASVAPVVQYYTAESKVGVYTTAEFANSSAGGKFVTASGQWLSSPVAVLKATAGGKAVTALVSLADPQYTAATQTLAFKTKLLPATRDAALPTAGGATDRLVDDSANGLATDIITAPAGDLTDVALFIDQNTQALATTAVVKYWHHYWHHGGWGWGDGWGGWGWRWHRHHWHYWG